MLIFAYQQKYMLTLSQIIDQYHNIEDEIVSLYNFVMTVANEYHKQRTSIPIAAKNGYVSTARQINEAIDIFNNEIYMATSGRTNAVLYGPMLSEKQAFMDWLNDVYYHSPLQHIPENSIILNT